MPIGIGGGMFGVRGGISTRGVGVGVGPLSAGTSWRGGGGGIGALIGALMVVGAIVLIFVWPFLLGSYLAVDVLGADNPSLLRSTIGWIFEVPWLAFLGWAAITVLRRTRANTAAGAADDPA